MGIEDRMKSLEEAIRENTAALLGDKPKSTKADKADSKDEDAPARSRRSSSKDDKDDKKSDSKSKKLTIDDVRKAYADYLGPKDGKDYDDNADFVGAVLDELGADTIKTIKEEDFAKAMHWITLKSDGKKVRFDIDLPDEEEERPRRRRNVE